MTQATGGPADTLFNVVRWGESVFSTLEFTGGRVHGIHVTLRLYLSLDSVHRFLSAECILHPEIVESLFCTSSKAERSHARGQEISVERTFLERKDAPRSRA